MQRRRLPRFSHLRVGTGALRRAVGEMDDASGMDGSAAGDAVKTA
ncbi:hypothetical protein [uncultured Cardiobacterium sp.]|nr:hypothetical protein [uncultured Cardiobacterium sp.]